MLSVEFAKYIDSDEVIHKFAAWKERKTVFIALYIILIFTNLIFNYVLLKLNLYVGLCNYNSYSFLCQFYYQCTQWYTEML